ncbi:MAG: hypothetical protein ACT4OM_05135 [Actinomycetota bacterium]
MLPGLLHPLLARFDDGSVSAIVPLRRGNEPDALVKSDKIVVADANPIDSSPQQGVLDGQLLQGFDGTLELLLELGNLLI